MTPLQLFVFIRKWGQIEVRASVMLGAVRHCSEYVFLGLSPLNPIVVTLAAALNNAILTKVHYSCRL